MESTTAERTAFILFTDIYRSTQLWEKYPKEFGRSLEMHNSVVEDVILSHGGEIMKNLGDGYIAIFDTPAECVRSGVEIQRKIKDIPAFPDGTGILVRVVGHGGTLQPLAAGRGYFGRPLNRASRICQVCQPGQVMLSAAIVGLLDGVPDGSRLIDLGTHRLRDLSQPERLYQLDDPGFALHEFPSLSTLDSCPNNLVYQPNEFIGRAREMAELRELLLGKKQRLVTITAPGGYGKSRLATHLCANMLDCFENGVFEVLLAPVGDADRIVTTTADALGFQFFGRADPQQQLIDYLREKQMLISFDNFEHLLAGKELLNDILQQAPGVSILVTSREPLRLKAEKVYQLEPLPVESDEKGRGEVEDISDAAALFTDRAILVKQGFALDSENLGLVSEICARLDGVPLAVELAAGWADSFTLREMLEEVSEQLELTARMDDVPKRQRSIRASLDWSYGLLSEEQQRVLRAASTFKGGFFLEAAAAIVPTRSLRRNLTELCDKGWMFTREVLDKTRFFVRDAATHQYALEKLEEASASVSNLSSIGMRLLACSARKR